MPFAESLFIKIAKNGNVLCYIFFYLCLWLHAWKYDCSRDEMSLNNFQKIIPPDAKNGREEI